MFGTARLASSLKTTRPRPPGRSRRVACLARQRRLHQAGFDDVDASERFRCVPHLNRSVGRQAH
eukprot:2974893-Lingulodinium_polyedra.AAC.1